MEDEAALMAYVSRCTSCIAQVRDKAMKVLTEHSAKRQVDSVRPTFQNKNGCTFLSLNQSHNCQAVIATISYKRINNSIIYPQQKGLQAFYRAVI